MRHFSLLLLACALLLPAERARAETPAEQPHPWVLQTTTALLAGALTAGYTLVAMDRFGARGDTMLLATPVPVAAAMALGVWLGGYWGGADASLWKTELAGLVPALLAHLVIVAAADDVDHHARISLLVTPLVAYVAAMVGFEVSRDGAGAGGDALVRRAVVDERIRQ